jgi:hypothetical protein
MRAHVPVLAVSLLLACSDDQDPLDGLTKGGISTSSSSASGGGPSGSTGDAGSDSDPTTTDNTTNNGTTATTTSATTGDPATTDPGTVTTQPTVSSTTTTGDPGDPFDAARQLCVDTINMYRATLGLPPYARWTDAETCSDAEALSDGQTDTPHGSFGMCDEFAQNECPGWPGPPEQSLPGCLADMWAEGPGEDFQMHGHYINMSSEQYTRVACGFAEVNGGWWMVQNFQ